jgi:signal transduction histidine kinase
MGIRRRLLAAWRRQPARTRLTLWYVLLVTGTQLLLGSLALWLIGRALYANADDVLRSRADAVQVQVDLDRGRLSFTSEAGPLGSLPAVADGLDVVRVWDRGQRVVFQKVNPPDLAAPDPSAIQAALDGESQLATERAPDGTNLRLYLDPVKDKGRVIAVVQVGRSLGEVEGLLGKLRLIGAGGLLVALALAWGGGGFLAARALAPVDQITRAAEQVQAEDLSQRLALDLPDDELGRLAAAFDRMIDRLDQAFQRQRRFTADASHELRTPLSIIRVQAEAARDCARDPLLDAAVLSSIHDESLRLGQLIECLLVLARADDGQALKLTPLDLEELVADVGEQIVPRVRQHGLTLAVTVDETPEVRGDNTWLTQLLLNLLDNALRHTPSGGELNLSLTSATGGALLSVADTGEGIASEHLPRLFERFYRIDYARGRADGGTGLGLAICDWIARAHGGRLTVQSQLGCGTTFSLWLPAV